MRWNRGQKPAMSAYRAATEACAACGAELPVHARFCPGCGIPAVPTDSNLRAAMPSSSTSPEPHLYGVAPPLPLLGLVVATTAIAVVLFLSGHWPFGLIVLGVAGLLIAVLVELVGRRPHSSVTRATKDARERTRSVLETWRARVAVTAEARRTQSGLARVDAERRSTLLELGTAVHRGDEVGEGGARARLAELDRQEKLLHEQLSRSLEQAGERIREARFAVEETMMVTPPEPYPPPGEATPPEPAIVPEPYPPPDEGTPPAPAVVPEPGPDPKPDRDT